MKKIWLYSSLVIPVLLVVITVCWNKREPQYVENAHERVGSYLSYSYGPTDCNIKHDKGNNWVLDCKDVKGKNDFNYLVRSSEDEPGGFYLTAISKDAKVNAGMDLMTYLDIKVIPNHIPVVHG